MDIIIEFCQANYSTGSDQVRDQLVDDPDLDADIIEYGCLGNCGQCFLQPYAMVNGDIVAGDSPADLLQKIKETISRKQKEDDEWKKLGF